MFPHAFKLKIKFQLEEEGIRNIFCGIFVSVQDCTKFASLITNVLLQLVKDFINGVCYWRCEKHLEQQKRSSRCLMFALQKKIWKRNYS